MNTYLILRRSGWRSPEDLKAAAERSTNAVMTSRYRSESHFLR